MSLKQQKIMHITSLVFMINRHFQMRVSFGSWARAKIFMVDMNLFLVSDAGTNLANYFIMLINWFCSHRSRLKRGWEFQIMCRVGIMSIPLNYCWKMISYIFSVLWFSIHLVYRVLGHVCHSVGCCDGRISYLSIRPKLNTN